MKDNVMQGGLREKDFDAYTDEVSRSMLDDAVDALVSLQGDREWTRDLYEEIRPDAIDLVMGAGTFGDTMRRGDVRRMMDIASTIMFDKAKNKVERMRSATRIADCVAQIASMFYSNSFTDVEIGGESGPGLVLSDGHLRRLDRLFVEHDRLRREELALATYKGDVFELPEELVAIVAAMRELRDAAAPTLREWERLEQEERRQERIEAHRQPDVVMEGRKCATCGKKPARVDDLCKKCAHAAGTLPHGKIGEA